MAAYDEFAGHRSGCEQAWVDLFFEILKEPFRNISKLPGYHQVVLSAIYRLTVLTLSILCLKEADGIMRANSSSHKFILSSMHREDYVYEPSCSISCCT